MSPRNTYQCVGFKQLILESLLEVPDHMLPLKDLYAVLQQKEPSLSDRKSDWKVSFAVLRYRFGNTHTDDLFSKKGTVRHILSAMPNFVRVPDHSQRGVWAVLDGARYNEMRKVGVNHCKVEDYHDDDNQAFNSSPTEEESELPEPEIVLPSQWHNHSWATTAQSTPNSATAMSSYQMNPMSFEMHQLGQMNAATATAVPSFNKASQHNSVLEASGRDGMSGNSQIGFQQQQQQFNPFQSSPSTANYHHPQASDWNSLNDIIHQYPDVFQSLNQK